MIEISTTLTPEDAAKAAVRFLSVSTLRARLRGVGRVYRNHLYACHLRLVLYHPPEFSKRPLADRVPLTTPEPCPVTDAAQILNSYSATGACSLVNEPSAYYVVCVPFESSLPAGDL